MPSFKDIAAFFEQFEKVPPEAIIVLVLAGLIVFLLLGSFGIIMRAVVPGLMTSLGIFGTFWGILIALDLYQQGDLLSQERVEQFVDAMKAAFYTSLLGLMFAIGSKTLWSTPFFVARDTRRSEKNLASLLSDIRWAISGNDGGSLLPQMFKLRQENSRGLERLNTKTDAISNFLANDLEEHFRKAHSPSLAKLSGIKEAIDGNSSTCLSSQLQDLRSVSETGFSNIEGLSNTIKHTLTSSINSLTQEIHVVVGKVLAESLETLIKEIEDALIKKFGESFQHFNEAVQALNKWQADHRAHVEELTKAYKETVTGIVKIRDASAELPSTAEKLKAIIESAQPPLLKLNQQLDSFASLGQQARQAFPDIKKNLDQIGDDLQRSAESFAGLKDTMTTLFSNSKQVANTCSKEVEKAVSQMQDQVSKAVNRIMQESQKQAKYHAQAVQEVTTDMVESVSQSVKAVTKKASNFSQQNTDAMSNLSEHMSSTMEQVQKDSARKVQAITDEAISSLGVKINAELQRVAETWGNHMVSIADALADVRHDVSARRDDRV